MGMSEWVPLLLHNQDRGREWGRRVWEEEKKMCVHSNSNCQLYQERTRVEGQRIERLNKSDIKNKPTGEKWKILWKTVSSVVLVILTKHDITGRRARDKERQQKADRTERGQSEREKENEEWGPKNKTRKRVKMTAPKMSWDLFTGEGVKSERTLSTSSIPDCYICKQLEELCRPFIFPLQPSLHPPVAWPLPVPVAIVPW